MWLMDTILFPSISRTNLSVVGLVVVVVVVRDFVMKLCVLSSYLANVRVKYCLPVVGAPRCSISNTPKSMQTNRADISNLDANSVHNVFE